MKINTFVYELLLENETVIIPGFGAFISHYKPAEIHPESNEIIPPGKTLSFNQKIRNNDGLLVGYIAEKEGISHFDALKEIEKERENIIYQLDKGEKITFENTGVLSRNSDNEIEFEPFQQDNLLLDSFGLEATSLTPSEPEIEEEENAEQVIPDTEVAEEKYENTEAESSESEDLEENAEQEKEESSETIHETTAFLKEQLVFDEAEPEVPIDDQDEKKKRGWIWFLLIFIPLIGAGIYLYLNQNKKVSPIPTEEQSVENGTESQAGIISADTTKSDSSVAKIAGTIQKTDSAKTSENAENQGKYYLVGGSFKQKENVEKFMNEFDAEGFTPFHLGKRGNFYIVAIGRYNTEKEAVIAQNKFIKKNPESGTWIYKDETNNN